ncbi:spore germination protein [Evansella cellulosilytica]|uniref:GerA spore germination protein n=1 Tax=Evansella cellulosilytica (strain ATCC 21833 / DSM 2522 / FERM P-1141 / JCM 9156 / N-4) TaxID=649639 RepID=E6TWX4_EVAC2|nr:spore germination protein [Evansella cellulosilytica]ADU29924.1 GerA spore germination protein [Evansella cellulosilytica DSM 2522]
MDSIKRPASKDLNTNVSYLKDQLAVDKNFDIVFIELEYSGISMALFAIDAFAKDQAITQIQREFIAIKDEDNTDVINLLTKTKIPFIEIETNNDLEEVITQLLSGQTVLVIEGYDDIILIDTREYPVRGPEEPDTEKVIRGSKDGFVETLVFNVGLMRRRVRNRTLRNEYVRIGRRSHSDICITYIDDIADHSLVEHIKSSLQNIDTDGLPMGDKTIEEYLFGQYTNPYPLVRYTERPDVAATHLFEGHVLVMVDGSPSVIITPTTFWNHLQHAEEYRQKPAIGTALRLVRFAAVWASIFLLPLWYLYAMNQDLLPYGLSYLGTDDPGEVPLLAQFLIAETGIEMLRMAAIHTPNALATALGLVAAILIGEVAMEVGLFTPEVVLYLAVAAIGTFATPSYELSLANRLIRVIFLIFVAIFHVPGYMIGTLCLLILLTTMKAYDTPYLWPFIPFNAKSLRDVLFRAPIPLKKRRPRAIHPLDPDK